MAKTTPFSPYYVYGEFTANDSSILQSLAIKYSQEGKKKLPHILGGSFQENAKLASAYSTNKKLYPYAYVIYDKESREKIGCLISQLSPRKVLEVTILLNTKIAHHQTIEVLSEFMDFVSKKSYHINLVNADERVIGILTKLNATKTKKEAKEDINADCFDDEDED